MCFIDYDMLESYFFNQIKVSDKYFGVCQEYLKFWDFLVFYDNTIICDKIVIELILLD